MRLGDAVVLSLLALLVVPDGAAQDLYKKPGHRGPLEEPPPDVVIKGRSSGKVPERLACDVRFRVKGLAEQRVEDCRGADYVHLYQDALEEARDEASTIRCELTCSPVHVFEVARKTDCSGHRAYAEVTVAALCTNKEKPPPMARPTSGQLDEPMSAERTRYAGQADVYVTKERTARPRCPGTSYVHWVHVEHESDCLDYSEAVSRAETESQAFYDSITCGPECKKTSSWVDSVVYTSWDCHSGFFGSLSRTLVVDIYIKLVCEPK